MKLNHLQLSQHLAKNLGSIYILSGDETLLVMEAADSVREIARAKEFTERTSIPVDPGMDWGKLLHVNTNSFSLFATKRIFEINLTQTKFTQANTVMLQAYAANPPPDTLLLIQTNKIDSKTEQTKWFQTLEKNAVFVPIWPIPSAQMPQWILQRAKKIGVSLTSDAAEWLANQAEGNLLAISQEIEKISLLQSNTIIDREMLEEFITDNARFDIFDLVDNTLAGKSRRSLRILKNLAESDVEPVLILWAFTRELRVLSELAREIKQNIPLRNLFSQFRIFEKRQGAVRAFLQRHQQKHCWDFLCRAAEIDRFIKGAEMGNVWDALEKLVVAVACPSDDI